MLTLHIGLPKTGSTFLQYRVFNLQQRYSYVNNSAVTPLIKALRRYVRAGSSDADKWRAQILDLIPEGDVLISDETITMDSREPWTGEGSGPERTVSRLAGLAGDVNGIRLILGVRRQDTWLASRYSESARIFSDFNQVDFEERLDVICNQGPVGVLQWLNYYYAWSLLVEHLGKENVLFLPQELLANNPVGALEGLERFLELSGLAEAYRSQEIDPTQRNVLSAGPGTWNLRGRDGQVLSLSEGMSKAILERFGEGNRELPNQRWLGFHEYGYC